MALTVTTPVANPHPSYGGLGIAGLAGLSAGLFVMLIAACAGGYWWRLDKKAHKEQLAV